MAHAIFFNPPLEPNYLGHQIAEIYKEAIYSPFLQGKSNLTIIDVGGFIGVTSYYFSQFAKDVFTLEPAKEAFDLMNKMLAYNGITNVHTFQKALYMEEGKYPLYHNKDNKTMSSLNQFVNYEALPEEVETTVIDKFFEENKIERVDLLKLDCEGSEYEILGHESFGRVADKIEIIVGEIHSWADRHPNQLKEALVNRGFVNFRWGDRTRREDPQMFAASKK